jgi:hypothetical protein
MIELDKAGGRTIHLYIPFEHNKKKIEVITLAPLRLGHVLRWNEGAWTTSTELLVELAGVDEAVIRDLRYPDADRVLDQFMQLLTPEIRDDVINGRVPLKAEPDEPADSDVPRVTNGSGGSHEFDPATMQGPGAPLPEAGFDMSEEP